MCRECVEPEPSSFPTFFNHCVQCEQLCDHIETFTEGRESLKCLTCGSIIEPVETAAVKQVIVSNKQKIGL